MILNILILLLLVITLVGYNRSVWWFSILDFFRLQYAVAGFILTGFALYNGDIVSLVLCLIVTGLNLYRIRKFLPFSFNHTTQIRKQILSFNTYKENHNPEEIISLIRQADPDLMLMMEMTEEMETNLQDVLKSYPDRLETYVRDGFRICLFSKTPLHNKNIQQFGPGCTPLLCAQTDLNGKRYQIFSAHPKPALNKQWDEERHAYFHEIEKVIGRCDLPKIVLGDFNSVPWENHFNRFLSNTDLKSTVQGYGYRITWPVYLPVLGVPMDHILLSRNENYSCLNVGPYAGSDHYPVSINL